MHPDRHRDYERDRHRHLLREARAGRLAAAVAASRRTERVAAAERVRLAARAATASTGAG